MLIPILHIRRLSPRGSGDLHGPREMTSTARVPLSQAAWLSFSVPWFPPSGSLPGRSGSLLGAQGQF